MCIGCFRMFDKEKDVSGCYKSLVIGYIKNKILSLSIEDRLFSGLCVILDLSYFKNFKSTFSEIGIDNEGTFDFGISYLIMFIGIGLPKAYWKIAVNEKVIMSN